MSRIENPVPTRKRDAAWTDAKAITHKLGGDWHGHYGTAPDIGHGPKDRGLSITNGRDGRLLVFSHHSYPFTDIVAHLRDRGLLPASEYVGTPPMGRTWATIVAERKAEDRRERVKRKAQAERLWQRAALFDDAPVRAYLGSRGVNLGCPNELRFVPDAWCAAIAKNVPAMVARVTDERGDLLGVHRTFLAPDFRGKADLATPKLSLGPVSDGAVQLSAPGYHLAIAEGIETTLSFAMMTGLPVWATLSTSGMAAVRLPGIVRKVTIAADRDPNGAGLEAAKKAAQRFANEGRDVKIVLPPEPFGDFNDALNAGGGDARR